MNIHEPVCGLLVRVNEINEKSKSRVINWLTGRGYKQNYSITGYYKTLPFEKVEDEQTVLLNYDDFVGRMLVFTAGLPNSVVHTLRINGKGAV